MNGGSFTLPIKLIVVFDHDWICKNFTLDVEVENTLIIIFDNGFFRYAPKQYIFYFHKGQAWMSLVGEIVLHAWF